MECATDDEQDGLLDLAISSLYEIMDETPPTPVTAHAQTSGIALDESRLLPSDGAVTLANRPSVFLS